MKRTKRTRRRNDFFSLKARMERRALRVITFAEPGARHDLDDGCPICVAERTGEPYDVTRFLPGPDGSPPDFEKEYVVSEARKAFDREKPRAGGAPVPFMSFGVTLADGSMATSAYCIESDGRIYWTSPTQRTFVAQLPHLEN